MASRAAILVAGHEREGMLAVPFRGRFRWSNVLGVSEQTIGHGTRREREECTAEQLAILSAAGVSDSLDAIGMRNQVLTSGLQPLSRGSRIAGRAATVQFAPTETDSAQPYAAAIEFIDSLTPGSVPVIATNSDGRTAYWGELFSAAAIGRGAVGTICDGPARDTAKIRKLGYPVFAANSRPIDFRARMMIVSAGAPVRCGGGLVTPGDLIIGDDDGIVVVPRPVEAEVLSLAFARASTEQTVLDELLAGTALQVVWDRWKVL